MGLHKSQGITLPQLCHAHEQNNPHLHDHNASLCDQARKYLKNLPDAVSSKREDENESITPRGVLEFFCLVEIFSEEDQILNPERLSNQQPHPHDHQQNQNEQQPSYQYDQNSATAKSGYCKQNEQHNT